MNERLTDEEIDALAASLPQPPWGIGSRRPDAREFARAIESAVIARAAVPAVQPTKAQREFAELSEPARRALVGASTKIMHGVHARPYMEHNPDHWLCFEFNTWDEVHAALLAVKAWDSAGYRAKDDAAPQSRPGEAATERDVPPGKWKVDMPDGIYGTLPGDPPGPCDVRKVIDGYVYFVTPRTGELVALSPPTVAALSSTPAHGDGGGVAPAPEPCPRGADKPEQSCTNRHQCWEPCGELGHSAEHARVGRTDPAEVKRILGVMVVGAPAVKPPCTVCGTAYEKHGSYPTCASHPYSPDGRCGHVGIFADGRFTGAPCAGAECRNGCARAHGVQGIEGDTK